MTNKQARPKPSRKAVLEGRIRTARVTTLLIPALTLVNCLLLATGMDLYFLFSAMFPYYLVWEGRFAIDKLQIKDASPSELNPYLLFYILLAVALILTAVYVVCWVVSRKRPFAGLLISLIWFGFDTLSMVVLFGVGVDSLMNYVLHALAIVELILGVTAAASLKKLPPEEPNAAPAGAPVAAPANFDGYGVAPNFPVSPVSPDSAESADSTESAAPTEPTAPDAPSENPTDTNNAGGSDSF